MSGYTVQHVEPSTGRPLDAPRRLVPFSERDPLTLRPLRRDDPYPTRGTIEDVLAWVGYDPERAKAATAAEHGRGKPRRTLLAELSERTG